MNPGLRSVAAVVKVGSRSRPDITASTYTGMVVRIQIERRILLINISGTIRMPPMQITLFRRRESNDEDPRWNFLKNFWTSEILTNNLNIF